MIEPSNSHFYFFKVVYTLANSSSNNDDNNNEIDVRCGGQLVKQLRAQRRNA